MASPAGSIPRAVTSFSRRSPPLAVYAPEASAGVRWDDPTLAIEWPAFDGERTISDRDRALPLYEPDAA